MSSPCTFQQRERVREVETHRRAQKYMYTDVHRRTQTGVIKYQFCDNGKDCARVQQCPVYVQHQQKGRERKREKERKKQSKSESARERVREGAKKTKEAMDLTRPTR